MTIPQIVLDREKLLLAELSAINAYKVVMSKEASATIRQCSKLLDDSSVQLRRELVATDKQLGLSKDA